MIRFLLAGLMAAALAAGASIAEKTAGMTRMDGLFPLYWDAKSGSLFLEVSRWGEEFLLYTSLPAGLGSNDVGLDRGQTGRARVVRFERVGPKILLIEANRRYRSSSSEAAEQRAVADSFASTVHWGFAPAAEEGARVLVDATAFFVRDGHEAAAAVRRAKAGSYRVDAGRSAVWLERTKSFPRNTEVEVLLTFAGEPQGGLVGSVSPSAEAFTVREHYSFVALPGPGFEPKALDPRSSFNATTYLDYSTPLGEPMTKRWAIRHRLPIRYYLDPGTPEPVRSALLEGARWWAQAFPAGQYTVEMLPEGADPMDARYNMINWVHRSTRGWSYGASIVDPRTGEILKGNVTLGSLRVRQDYLIAEGVLAPYERGKAVSPAMREMGLARLRQLSAHEVGHTLGLAHNFAASANGRASVMDYPHPQIDLDADGKPTLRNAYAVGLGDWDKMAIGWGYLGRPLVFDRLRFLSDQDARDEGGASPVAHLWDNGANAVDELNRLMTVRRKILARFGEENIPEGEALSALGDRLVPMYLLHRYQTEAAVKVLGGVDYSYALRGDGQKIAEPVAPAEQRRALAAVLATIDPAELEIPERILRLLPPRAFGYEATREQFASRTGLTFDPVAAAESAANHTVGLLLHPDRAGRLEQLAARVPGSPGFGEVLRALLARPAMRKTGLQGEIQKAVRTVVMQHLMVLVADGGAQASARAIALDGLLQMKYEGSALAVAEIDRFLRDGKPPAMAKPLPPPPGQPIGCEEWF
ncbi:MAG: zinc-dependent metalloprotease [Acidobacteriota bacterium]